jgi:hypothetical protein
MRTDDREGAEAMNMTNSGDKPLIIGSPAVWTLRSRIAAPPLGDEPRGAKIIAVGKQDTDHDVDLEQTRQCSTPIRRRDFREIHWRKITWRRPTTRSMLRAAAIAGPAATSDRAMCSASDSNPSLRDLPERAKKFCVTVS